MATHRSTTSELTVVAAAALIATVIGGFAAADRPEPDPVPLIDMRAEHTSMMEQMRQASTPQMVERMNDPTWRRMREPAHVAEMEAHLRDSDRMLGRSP